MRDLSTYMYVPDYPRSANTLFHYGRSRDLDFSHEYIPDFSTGRLKLSTGDVEYSVFLFARFSNLSKARNRDS